MSNKIGNIECEHKIIEFLKKNSDKNNKISQKMLRDLPEMNEYVRSKTAFNRLINQMAIALNSDIDGNIYENENEWRIVFDAFIKCNQTDYNEDVENIELGKLPIRGLYYNHIFSYEEIDRIIESLHFSKSLDSKRTEELAKKITEHLTTVFYTRKINNICKVQEKNIIDDKLLSNNLILIQNAIKKESQIIFQFNEINLEKKLVPSKKELDIVSPYYIVASEGKYYLIGCFENTSYERNMSIWRIDLMTDINFLKKGKQFISITNKKNCKNLPQYWDENFLLSHINMSFDNPVEIKLRINGCNEFYSLEDKMNNDIKHTFLYDWFGNNYTYLGRENEFPFGDIVTVKCSPFGMVNWALQYSSFVEVIEPLNVRNEIKNKIKSLDSKYNN